MDKYTSILHKRHGWIEAPENGYFTLSASGKSVELHEASEPTTETFYPFGTRWNLSSVLAWSD